MEHLLLLAAAALLVFWALGAYNRLVALRNAVIAAWAQVDEPLQRRAAALAQLADAARAPLHDEQGAIDAALAAQQRLQAAADAMRARPALAPRAAELGLAERALAAAAARLLALLEQRPAAAGATAPLLATLQDANTRLGFARQLFNDAVQAYNDAVHQFPASTLARLFDFRAAGTL